MNVLTANGVTTYSVRLTHSSSSSSKHPRGVTITVDADGNPAGNEDVPFSVLPTTIQNGINALGPTGSTALAASQRRPSMSARSMAWCSTRLPLRAAAHRPRSRSTPPERPRAFQPNDDDFGALTSTVQTAIQTLATANGVSGTIASTQSINVYTEANGTVLYRATLSTTSTKNTSVTFDITITVDSDGNPTVLPRRDLFGRFRGQFGFAGFDCGNSQRRSRLRSRFGHWLGQRQRRLRK